MFTREGIILFLRILKYQFFPDIPRTCHPGWQTLVRPAFSYRGIGFINQFPCMYGTIAGDLKVDVAPAVAVVPPADRRSWHSRFFVSIAATAGSSGTERPPWRHLMSKYRSRTRSHPHHPAPMENTSTLTLVLADFIVTRWTAN